MNVIFLDFDGVLSTAHGSEYEDIERRISILADICKDIDCKIVIEAGAKDSIDEDTLTSDNEYAQTVLNLLKKYHLEVIGKTPSVSKKTGKNSYLDMWKEDEILLYLNNHPEVENYCVIDDDDSKLYVGISDLDKVRDHLVTTVDEADNPLDEGILPIHKDEIYRILGISKKHIK